MTAQRFPCTTKTDVKRFWISENPEINSRILDAIENADMDVSQQEKLEREFAKEIHLLTAEPRLDSIAKDFVGHYSDLWTSGKAMLFCLNKDHLCPDVQSGAEVLGSGGLPIWKIPSDMLLSRKSRS